MGIRPYAVRTAEVHLLRAVQRPPGRLSLQLQRNVRDVPDGLHPRHIRHCFSKCSLRLAVRIKKFPPRRAGSEIDLARRYRRVIGQRCPQLTLRPRDSYVNRLRVFLPVHDRKFIQLILHQSVIKAIGYFQFPV